MDMARINYHGYLGLPRQVKLILRNLGYLLFGFYIGLVLEAVWDRKKDDFGCVKKTNSELTELFFCDESTVSRNLNKLVQKGFVRKLKRKIQITYFPVFEINITKKLVKLEIASVQELRAVMQDFNAELQEIFANLHEASVQKESQSFHISSSVHSDLSQDNHNENVDIDEVIRGMNEDKKIPL